MGPAGVAPSLPEQQMASLHAPISVSESSTKAGQVSADFGSSDFGSADFDPLILDPLILDLVLQRP